MTGLEDRYTAPAQFADAGDQLHELVASELGYGHFGPDDYLPGLKTLLLSMDYDPQFSERGRRIAWGELYSGLFGRAHAYKTMKEDPSFDARAIRGPLIITGIPRTGTTALHKLLALDPQFQGLQGWLIAAPQPRPPRETWDGNPLFRNAVERMEARHASKPGSRAASPGVMGGFAEYNRVPASVAIKLPRTLSLADGALVEPLAIGLHAVRSSHLEPGDRVLVLGAGSVALCAIYWARRLGAGRIVAMSRSQHRSRMALEMGADGFIAYGDDEVGRVIEALGGSPEIVYECVGNPGFLGKSIQHAAVYGQVVSLGFCTSPDSIMPAMAGYKGVSLQFPVGYSLKDFRYVADVMDKGHVDPKVLISAVVPLNDVPATFERLRAPHEETKVQVSPAGP